MQSKHPGVAWVLGASSGIGRATALQLARQGWTLALSGRRTAELEALGAEISEAGGSAGAFACDVTDVTALRAVQAQLSDSVGAPELVVHCSGVNTLKRHWDVLEAEDARRVIDINLGGVLNMLAVCVPAMRERRQGTIVVVSSWAGWCFTPFAGPSYSASKTALGPLVESVNQQAGAQGVRATLICPAEVATKLVKLV